MAWVQDVHTSKQAVIRIIWTWMLLLRSAGDTHMQRHALTPFPYFICQGTGSGMWRLSINITCCKECIYWAQIIIDNFQDSWKIAEITRNSHCSTQQHTLSTTNSHMVERAHLQTDHIILFLIITSFPPSSFPVLALSWWECVSFNGQGEAEFTTH